jgi:hypothetical protein
LFLLVLEAGTRPLPWRLRPRWRWRLRTG